MYATPKAPKGWHKNAISLFVRVKFNFTRKKSATKFLCVKTFSGKVVATSFPYPTVHRSIAGDVHIYLKLAFKVTHPFRKRRFRKLSFHSASAVRASMDNFLRQKFSSKNLVFSNISLMAIFAGNHPQRGRKMTNSRLGGCIHTEYLHPDCIWGSLQLRTQTY